MGIVLATISSVKDTDFEQAEDVTIRPVVETNLVEKSLRPEDWTTLLCMA